MAKVGSASTATTEPNVQCGISPEINCSMMSCNAKYNYAFRALKQVADCIADCGAAQFQQRMHIVNAITKMWLRNAEVHVIEASPETVQSRTTGTFHVNDPWDAVPSDAAESSMNLPRHTG